VLQAGERRSARIESLGAVGARGVVVYKGVLAGGGYHDPLPRTLAFGGSLGVFLFFALTGYLLFLPFARSTSGDGRPIDLGRYALNRAVRVLPLYYVVLVAFLLLNEHGGTLSQWWRFATFSQSFFSDTVSTVDGPMWSLVVEIQFYALLPLLAFGIARFAHSSRAMTAAAIAALGLVSVAVWWEKVGSVGGADLRWKYSLAATFFNFTPGMLLALLRLELIERPRAWLPSSTLLLAAGAVCWAAAADQLTYPQPLAAGAALLVVGAVVLPLRDGALARVLDARALVVVGIASYSLYLWHHPIVLSLGHRVDAGPAGVALVAVAVCVPIALASYALVERPFLRLRRRWGPTAASPAAVERARAIAPLEPGHRAA
jgi:peptidoglycan/LPS O-acetylase OafA/YrhL